MSQANMNNLSNGEISFKIDWTPEQKKAFKNITDFTELDDDYIKIEQLLKLVEKQQKEIEELKKYMKTNLIPKSTINLLYISKDKIKKIINKYVDIEEHLKYTNQELFGEDLKNMIKELLEE